MTCRDNYQDSLQGKIWELQSKSLTWKLLEIESKVFKTFTSRVCRKLNRFNMDKAKLVSTPLGSHFILSRDQLSKSKEERDHMSKVLDTGPLKLVNKIELTHLSGISPDFSHLRIKVFINSSKLSLVVPLRSLNSYNYSYFNNR